MTVAPYAMGSNLGEEEDEDETKRKADYYSALNVWVSQSTLLYRVKSLVITQIWIYSKTCLKRPLKNRQNKDLNDKW